jgi:hypothetical protein
LSGGGAPRDAASRGSRPSRMRHSVITFFLSCFFVGVVGVFGWFVRWVGCFLVDVVFLVAVV